MWLIGVFLVAVGFVSIVGFNVAYIPWLLIGLGALIIIKGPSRYRPHHYRGETGGFVEERHNFGDRDSRE
jgi:hypothetical protein